MLGLGTIIIKRYFGSFFVRTSSGFEQASSRGLRVRYAEISTAMAHTRIVVSNGVEAG